MKIDRHNDSNRHVWPRATLILLAFACGIGFFGGATQLAESEDSPAKAAPDASEENDAERESIQGSSVDPSVPPSLRARSKSAETEGKRHSQMDPLGKIATETVGESGGAEELAAEELPRETIQAHQAADRLIRNTMRRLTSGPAFDAKLTQHIWTQAQGREVVGVGRYEQAGEETGWFSMEMMIPTATGKCLLQQMSDGRLAWTREQVGDQVRLRRVDVGRLDELVPSPNDGRLRPGLRVGGLVELLQRLHTDYRLTRTAGKVDSRRVWVLRGTLRNQVASSIEQASNGGAWPRLYPREVLVAIAADDNEQGFGKGLPARIEFWSDRPDEVDGETNSDQIAKRKLISLLKIYDARPINPAPQQHFSFETGESDVQFINDTERYVQMFGVKLTAKERVMLLR